MPDSVSSAVPPPPGQPARFRATVHGTVFAGRGRLVSGLSAGDALRLVPDPPGQEPAQVWVHLPTGDPVGHLPPEIEAWMHPWLLQGGVAGAKVLRAEGDDVPSWRRLVIEVVLGEGDEGGQQVVDPATC